MILLMGISSGTVILQCNMVTSVRLIDVDVVHMPTPTYIYICAHIHTDLHEVINFCNCIKAKNSLYIHFQG